MFTRRRPETRIHFVGIGGIGMSGIAEVLLTLGYQVSGSDLKESDSTRRLASLGGVICAGHQAANLQLLGADADVVVISSAVRSDNPEVSGARARGIPVIPRAEMLAELMRDKVGIAIAGSHGKTTTTSLCATVLREAGLDPTAVIGGKLPQLGAGARLGQSEYMVAEADESDGSFLQLSPTVAVVTNIDAEHLDHYGDLTHLRRAFVDFINKVPFYGRAVLCLDHPEVAALLPQVRKRYVTYGLSAGCDYRAEDLRFAGLHTHFVAVRRGERLGSIELPMPGQHNVLNALATLAVADFVGIPFATVQAGLRGFGGVGRRFTVRGHGRLAQAGADAEPLTIIDDYGHHPAEIRATLAGARAGFPARRIVAVFQPHRFTRTRDLMSEFAEAFVDAEVVVVTDIYAAGEAPIPGITSAALSQAIQAQGHPGSSYIAQRSAVAPALLPQLKSGDLVITFGAGDIWQTGEELLRLLTEP